MAVRDELHRNLIKEIKGLLVDDFFNKNYVLYVPIGQKEPRLGPNRHTFGKVLDDLLLYEISPELKYQLYNDLISTEKESTDIYKSLNMISKSVLDPRIEPEKKLEGLKEILRIFRIRERDMDAPLASRIDLHVLKIVPDKLYTTGNKGGSRPNRRKKRNSKKRNSKKRNSKKLSRRKVKSRRMR